MGRGWRRNLLPVIACLSLGVRGVAADVPRRVTVQGVLRDGVGSLQSGVFAMTFRLYASSSAATPSWEETQDGVIADGGVFTVGLGSVTALPPAFFAQNPGAWLGVTVVGDASELTRFPLSSVPYAFEALHASDADTVGGLGPATFQPALSAAAPLRLASAQLSLDRCAAGQVLKTVGTAWVCAGDDDHLYAAGTGLVLDGGVFGVGPAVAMLDDPSQVFTGTAQWTAAGTALRVDDTASIARVQTTSVTSSAALAIGGTSVTVAASGTTRLTVSTNTTVTGPLRLVTGSGGVTLAAPTTGALSLTLPSADGVAGAALITDGAGVLRFKRPATVETNVASVAWTSNTLAEITGLRTAALTGDYLLMFSAVVVCATAPATPDGQFELRAGGVAIPGTLHSVIYVAAQRRTVAFQRYATGLTAQAVSAWASVPTGSTTCLVEQATLTALER